MKPLLGVVLVLCGAGFFVPVALLGMNVFDEGFIATGAMMVLDGALPYRDFLSMYGPGQYYLTAMLFAVFGQDVLVTRVAHAVILAVVSAVVYRCARSVTGGQLGVVAGVTAVYASVTVVVNLTVGYPAIPSALLVMVAAMSFSDWAAGRQVRRLVLASSLVGVAGLFRWDFGLFGLAALGLAALAVSSASAAAGVRFRASLRALLTAVGPGLGLMAVVYVPMIAAGGVARWYDEVLRFFLFDFSDWRNVEYLRPAYSSLWRAARDGNILESYVAILLLGFALVPPMLAIGGVLFSGWRLSRAAAQGGIDRSSALILVLSLDCLFFLNQMRVRPTVWQGFPAFLVSLPLAAYFVGRFAGRAGSTLCRKSVASVAAYVLFAVIGTLGAGGYLRALAGVSVEGSIARATWLRVPKEGAAYWTTYGELIEYVREVTQPGEYIFSGVRDTSRLFVNDAMIYFLADRRPAFRHIDLTAGLSNTAKRQRELVASLSYRGVKTMVLWERLSSEPNRTSVSNGVHVVDEFVREHFEEVRRFGAYSVWKRKGTE